MSNRNESPLPGVLFFGTWIGVAQDNRLEPYAFPITVGMFVSVWIAYRLVRNSIGRLGGRAWSLVGQLVVCAGLVLFLCPFHPLTVALLIWGLGVPLLLLGMGARWCFDHVGPRMQGYACTAGPYLAAIFFCALAVAAWLSGGGFLQGLAGAVILMGLSGIPVFYGWLLAEGYPRHTRDARFGDAEDLRRRGLGDEF